MAATPGSSEGGGGAPESVTLDNLGDQLMALEGNKLSVQQVTKALNIVNGNSQVDKQKLLALTINLLNGTYDAAAFEARLPKGGAATSTSTTTTGTPAAPGAPEVAGAAATPEAGAAAPDAEVQEVTAWTSDQIQNLLGTINQAKESVANDNSIDDEQIKQNFDRILHETTTLAEVDKQNLEDFEKRIKAVLGGLPPELKFDEKEETRLLKIDPLGKYFDTRFDKATEKLKNDPKGKLARESMLQTFKEYGEKCKQVEADMRKRMIEFHDVMNTIRNDLNTEGARMAAIKSYSKLAGIPLERDHKMTYQQASPDGLTFTRENAVIKDVRFIGTEPIIDVEFKSPATGELIVVPMSPASFNEWVEALNVTSDIQSLDELEKATDLKIQEGDVLEFDTVKPGGMDRMEMETHQVKIEKIDETNKTIDLDTPVKLAPGGQETKTLNFGEFSKWVLKNEVVHTIPDLEKLRQELNGFNEALNAVNKRSSKEYPPIEAKPGEVLKYEDGSDSTFMIAEADDKHVTLSRGDKFSLASFLRWVKKNQVIKDPEETKKAKEAKEKHDEEVANGEVPANDTGEEHDPHAHSDPHKSSDPSVSAAKFLWYRTRILSLHTVKEWGVKIFEFFKRKLNRKEEERIGYIGERIFRNVPWFGTELGAEFKGIAQHAENEEVNHHVEHMKTMGADTVKHELHLAPTKDVLKAAITVAAEKGSLRWDDPGLWDAFNKFTYGELRDPKTGGPLWVKEDNHMYAIEKYMDLWWGDDTFREFRNKADGSYGSIKNNFKEAAARLETDPERNGGLAGKLRSLMFKHIKGEYVNAAEYEEYLEFAITAGKLTFEDKLFFLIMGLGAQAFDPHGHGLTLLHEDRMGALSQITNTFPIIDYFTKGGWPQYDSHGHPVMDPATGKQKTGRINPEHFKQWVTRYVLEDCGVKSLDEVTSPDQLVPKANFSRFLLEDIASDEATKVRMEKASSDATRWDHDDIQFFGPMLSETGIDQILSRQGGARQTVSTPGLKNAYAGFNNFVHTKLGMLKKDALSGNKEAVQKDQRGVANLIKTFMRFDAILENRFQHDSASYSRFSQEDYGSKSGAGGKVSVLQYATELRQMIMALSQRLDGETGGRFNLVSTWQLIIDKRPQDKAAQSDAIKNFGEYLDGALADVSKQGQDKITNLLLEIAPTVGGIPTEDKPRSRTDEDEASGEMLQFKPYVNQVVISKVEQVKKLEKQLSDLRLKSPVQLKAEQAHRLGEIIQEVQANKYVGGSEDVEILDKEIRRLEGELTQKKAA